MSKALTEQVTQTLIQLRFKLSGTKSADASAQCEGA